MQIMFYILSLQASSISPFVQRNVEMVYRPVAKISAMRCISYVLWISSRDTTYYTECILPVHLWLSTMKYIPAS